MVQIKNFVWFISHDIGSTSIYIFIWTSHRNCSYKFLLLFGGGGGRHSAATRMRQRFIHSHILHVGAVPGWRVRYFPWIENLFWWPHYMLSITTQGALEVHRSKLRKDCAPSTCNNKIRMRFSRHLNLKWKIGKIWDEMPKCISAIRKMGKSWEIEKKVAFHYGRETRETTLSDHKLQTVTMCVALRFLLEIYANCNLNRPAPQSRRSISAFFAATPFLFIRRKELRLNALPSQPTHTQRPSTDIHTCIRFPFEFHFPFGFLSCL